MANGAREAAQKASNTQKLTELYYLGDTAVEPNDSVSCPGHAQCARSMLGSFGLHGSGFH